MDRIVTRVWLDESTEDCTQCGLCQNTCPEVFEVPEKMIVREEADKHFLSAQAEILEAAEACPVSVIALEYDGSGQRDNGV